MTHVTHKSIYVLLLLKIFLLYATVALPIQLDIDGKTVLKKQNHVMSNLNNFYTCVYIPPHLENCNFVRNQTDNDQIEKEKRGLLNNEKENINSWTKDLEMEEQFTRKAHEKIIIYEIQKCKPHRLPFTLPWCTKEDLDNEKSEIYRLVPVSL